MALPPLAGGLLHRRQHQPFRRPFLRPLAQEGVGRGHRLRHLHLQPRHGEVPGDALGGEEGLSTSKQYPRWETAWMGYPLSRGWEMAFHTALRLTWSCWARAWPER